LDKIRQTRRPEVQKTHSPAFAVRFTPFGAGWTTYRFQPVSQLISINFLLLSISGSDSRHAPFGSIELLFETHPAFTG
jgi:hypothetical protein